MFLSDNGAAPDGGVRPGKSGFGFGPSAKNNLWRKDGVGIRPGSGPKHPPGAHDTFAAYGLGWANVSNTPLRGTKITGYEGGIRTPLVARWPAVIRKHGQITTQVGHVIDFMATCLDVAGTNYPTEFKGRKPLPMEGKSLLPVFAGPQRKGHGSSLLERAPAPCDSGREVEGDQAEEHDHVAAIRSRSRRNRNNRSGEARTTPRARNVCPV